MKIRVTAIIFLLILLYSCQEDGEDPLLPLSDENNFTSFSFLELDNPSLIEDIHLELENTNVTGKVPYGTKIDSLIASYTFNGAYIKVEGISQESGIQANDFSERVEYTIYSENGDANAYIIDIQYFTGLPIISIFIDNNEEVISKEEYLTGTVTVYGGREYENLAKNIAVRGRGNSTWAFPKKSYQIKFESKEEILGMPEDKRWVLLANYSDKSKLRNEVAFDLGRLSNLNWTPESRFIELYINSDYSGTYQITQKVEESSNRVDLGADGFLIEVDQLLRLDPDDVYFETNFNLFCIKEPKLKSNDEKYLFIKNFIQTTETVLLGENFLDPVEGYAKYIDTESFVDWYLINEITKNNDALFYSSVFMNLVPGGKLKMGPIWDFDIALGNINYNSNEIFEGFWIKNALWVRRLFEDPDFVAEVKVRMNHFMANKEIIFDKIEENASYLNDSQMENYLLWPTLGTYVWPNNVYFDTYTEEVKYLEQWLDNRLDWLSTAIKDL